MTTRQLRSTDGTGTLSYLIEDSGITAIIDPNMEDLQQIGSLVQEMNLRVTHIIDTHTHADHISAAGALREKFNASVVMHENTKNKWKIVDQGDKFGIGDILRANAAVPVDRYVSDGDTIQLGSVTIRALFTPGHTDNHICLHAGDNLFTGDLLLIGQAGRSDLPGGDPGQQYDSLFNRVMSLPDATKIHPGHDYAEQVFAYLGDEKLTNPFLQHRSKAEYVAFVSEFFPPLAESVEGGGKVTLQCGASRVAQTSDSVKNIAPRQLAAMLDSGTAPILLDVREPFELATVGAINGVRNIPVGQLKNRLHQLPADKTAPLVCVCQSGSRSAEAAHFLSRSGYTNVLNLEGGTSRWMKEGFGVVRPTAMSQSRS